MIKKAGVCYQILIMGIPDMQLPACHQQKMKVCIQTNKLSKQLRRIIMTLRHKALKTSAVVFLFLSMAFTCAMANENAKTNFSGYILLGGGVTSGDLTLNDAYWKNRLYLPGKLTEALLLLPTQRFHSNLVFQKEVLAEH